MPRYGGYSGSMRYSGKIRKGKSYWGQVAKKQRTAKKFQAIVSRFATGAQRQSTRGTITAYGSKARMHNYGRGNPFPNEWYGWLNYGFDQNIGPAGSGLNTTSAVQVFNINSLFDPDLTSTGHQPYGHDQLSAIYNTYLVDEVELDIVWTGATVDSMGCYIQVQNAADTQTLAGISPQFAMERPNVWYVMCNTQESVRQKIRIKLPQLAGISKEQLYINENYEALTNANPNARFIAQLAVACHNAESGSQYVRANITMRFHAKYFNRFGQAPS